MPAVDPAFACVKVLDLGRPRLFKSVGMAWEDLVVAVAVYRTRPTGP